MRASPQSPRMFKSDFLDFFSRTPWWTVPLIWGPVSAYFVYTGFMNGVSALALLGQFVAGFVIWTLTEYWLHRTAFHWIPKASWGERYHFLVHGVHHDTPDDPYRLVMPPSVSIPLAILFYGLFRGAGAILAGAINPAWIWATYAGFIAGYLYYDVMHYALHHFKVRSRYLRGLRRHHLNHHAQHSDRKFGVSFMIWDRVFGTL